MIPTSALLMLTALSLMLVCLAGLVLIICKTIIRIEYELMTIAEILKKREENELQKTSIGIAQTPIRA